MNKKSDQIRKFKRNIVILSAAFLSAILAGCAPTKNIIPPLKYRDDIGIHSSKTAHIQWIPGKMVGDEKITHSHSSNSNGGLGAIVSGLVITAIDNQQRKNNPSQYVNEYAKADEVVFITSLRDVLNEQNVFKNVELVTDLNNVKTKDVLIKIYFKSARVTKYSNITLMVQLTIQAGKKPPFERTYLAQNNHEEQYKNFVENKTSVSQRLLSDIINGIKQWLEENK